MESIKRLLDYLNNYGFLLIEEDSPNNKSGSIELYGPSGREPVAIGERDIINYLEQIIAMNTGY